MSENYPSDVTDEQWQVLRKLLPKRARLGRPPIDRRRVVNAVLYLNRSGCQWRMLPLEYPKWKTVYTIFRRWRLDGTWQSLNAAVAAWLVWRQAGFAGAKLPLALFAIQLALNSLWSVLFFGLHQSGAAAVEIVLLWGAILATLIAFWRRSRWAGGLLVPYLAWVSFASVLNFTIWRLNA